MAANVGGAARIGTVTSLRAWSTPSVLRLVLIATWGLAFALWLVVSLGWEEHRRAVRTIGVDAAPSVEAAHKIKIHVETLDADLVNELLRAPGAAADSVSDFERARVETGKQLVAAAKNITYGDAELVPIQRMQDGLGRYLMAAQAARTAHARNDPRAMLDAYRDAYAILSTELLPNANALNTANDDVLQASYESLESRAKATTIAVTVIGGALLATLLGAQVFLLRRFRRLLNPACVAATVVLTWFVIVAIRAFVSHAGDMKGMKEDSYDSVLALLDTRADAYEANAAESRWLLDRDSRAAHERSFREYSEKLATFRGGQTFSGAIELARQRNGIFATAVAAGVSGTEAGRRARRALPFTGFSGSLARGLDNVTFAERDPQKDEPTQSLETLRTFGVYHDLDAQIRALEDGGRHAEAVRFCLGMAPGESNWAFFEFDQALGRWLTINQDWMAHYTERAFADVAGLEYEAPAVAIALAVLVFLGLRPRMREYAA